jgi:hypothetical protein
LCGEGVERCARQANHQARIRAELTATERRGRDEFARECFAARG